MKTILLICLASVAFAHPQVNEEPVGIIRNERLENDDGSFTYAIEAENGIAQETSYIPGSEGQINMEGVIRFPLPDGTTAVVRFIADENGYHALSDLIPNSHPLPSHAIEQIRIGEEQHAKGITFE